MLKIETAWAKYLRGAAFICGGNSGHEVEAFKTAVWFIDGVSRMVRSDREPLTDLGGEATLLDMPVLIWARKESHYGFGEGLRGEMYRV